MKIRYNNNKPTVFFNITLFYRPKEPYIPIIFGVKFCTQNPTCVNCVPKSMSEPAATTSDIASPWVVPGGEDPVKSDTVTPAPVVTQ